MKTEKLPKDVLEKAEKVGNVFEALEAIEIIVSDCFSFDLECNLAFDRLTTETEKTAAIKLGEIYKIAHASNPKHSCYGVHENWRVGIKKFKEEAKEL